MQRNWKEFNFFNNIETAPDFSAVFFELLRVKGKIKDFL
jgi:hypothetical protein